MGEGGLRARTLSNASQVEASQDGGRSRQDCCRRDVSLFVPVFPRVHEEMVVCHSASL